MSYDGSIRFDTSISSDGFKSGLNKIGSIAKTGLKAVGVAVGAATAGIAGMGVAAAKVGSDFEAGMSKVQAISGAAGEELTALTEKAKEMGAKTKFSASESAEAFEYMAMAGWKTADMLDGIEGIMNLAAASGEELGSVSDIVTDSLTAFGLAASDAGHFSDVLAKASSSSNTNVGMMGATFKYVAPIAGAMKYSIEDTALAIGLMANAGIKGEQAGTSLRAMLTRLVKPPKDAAVALKSLGISATNSDGSMKPLKQTLAELREKFKGLDDSQKASYASSIAGTEAMSGMLAIMNASDKDFETLANSIANADGAALEMADTMQDNLQGQITILKSSLEGLGIEIYDGMQEPLKNAAKYGIQAVNDLTQAFKTGGLPGMVAEAGDLFADFAIKIAEQAPKMVDAAVEFIKSFVGGIKKNAPKLLEAAEEIVNTIVNGLVKLLPLQVQKPVAETVDGIKRSFKDGGLKSAIGSASKLIKSIAEIALDLAKVALPVVTKGIDLLGRGFKVIAPLIAGAATAMAVYNLAVKAGTIVQTLSNAVRGMQAAFAAYQSGASLAAAAQTSLNLAILANPFALLAAGFVGAAVAGGLLVNSLFDTTSETSNLCEQTDELIQKNRNLIDTLQERANQRAESQEGLEAEAGANKMLADRLFELNNKAEKTNSDKAEMIALVDTLNEKLPDLQLNIDEETGKLSNQKDEVYKVIDANLELMKVKAAQEDLAEISKGQYEAEKSLAELEEQRAQINNELSQKIADINLKHQEYGQTNVDTSGEVGKLTSEERELENQLAKIDNEIASTKGTIEQYGKEFETAMSYIGEHKNLDAAADSVENVANSTQNLASQAPGAAHEFSEGADQIGDSAKNAETAAAQAFEELPKDMKQTAQDAADQAGNAIESKAPEVAGDAKTLKDSIVNEFGDLPQSFSSIGASLVEGLWSGMNGRAGWLKNKIGTFVNDAVNAAKQAAEVNSPSKLMARTVGEPLGEGLGYGFERYMPKLARDMQGGVDQLAGRLHAKETVQAFRTLSAGVISSASNPPLSVSYAGGYPSANSQPQVVHNDNSTQETINVYQKVDTPGELFRAAKNRRKELAFG